MVTQRDHAWLSPKLSKYCQVSSYFGKGYSYDLTSSYVPQPLQKHQIAKPQLFCLVWPALCLIRPLKMQLEANRITVAVVYDRFLTINNVRSILINPVFNGESPAMVQPQGFMDHVDLSSWSMFDYDSLSNIHECYSWLVPRLGLMVTDMYGWQLILMFDDSYGSYYDNYE